jgi:hypothetical protein
MYQLSPSKHISTYIFQSPHPSVFVSPRVQHLQAFAALRADKKATKYTSQKTIGNEKDDTS